jgi:O-acetyl-ADP-ribose deacetylase (regulator of RNase III)
MKDDFDIMIHGANCFNAMGAGIAGQIARKLPEARMADDDYVVRNNVQKLSNYSYAFIRKDNNKIGTVINLYTQFYPGPDLDENALILGFKKLSRILDKGLRIGIPQIGCGIANGNWDVIGPRIAKIMINHDITVVEYEKQKENV